MSRSKTYSSRAPSSSCVARTTKPIKITVPGPFTMSRQAAGRLLQGRGGAAAASRRCTSAFGYAAVIHNRPSGYSFLPELELDRSGHPNPVPRDLRGRKVGLAEHRLTKANVWIRAFLEDDFGVEPTSIHWVRGGIEVPGRSEKIPIATPHGLISTEAPAGRSLSGLLLAGEIDALIGPRTPSCQARGYIC